VFYVAWHSFASSDEFIWTVLSGARDEVCLVHYVSFYLLILLSPVDYTAANVIASFVVEPRSSHYLCAFISAVVS
jgi:hypothetical protein